MTTSNAGNSHHGQPHHYPITIRLEPVDGEPINGEEMFIARCEHFPKLAMAEESPGKTYDGLMAMVEKIWASNSSRDNRR